MYVVNSAGGIIYQGLQGPKGDAGTAGVGVPLGGDIGQVITKTGADDFTVGWADPSGGSDEWRTAITTNVLLAAQLSAARMGFADGWIDSLLDTSGLNLASCAGVFSVGQASGATDGDIATPAMTSNTTPSGVITADNEYGGSYPAWKAFNQTNVDHTDSWAASGTPLIGTPSSWHWIKYDFGSAHTIPSYKLITRNYGTDSTPNMWDLVGSNDDSTWDVIDSQSYTFATTGNVSHTFTCATPGNYRYYKFIFKNTLNSNGYITLGEIQLFGPGAALVLESASATVTAGSEYLIVLSVNSGKSFTVEVDAGAGWETVTTSTTPQSATIDQISGTITRTGGSAVKVKVTAADNTGIVYGWGCFWR